ncbi:MAG: QueT transporter family protein [Clostridia bacterium]|nr:QueT transporter family protein [Clostridia bacterium]
MKKTTSSLHRLAETGLIAALYAVMTLVLSPISFGAVQLRFSESLTILPVFSKNAVTGLALGCVIANAVGVATGANIAGALDILLGTSATLAAAICTRALRNVTVKGFPVLSTLPPVIFNAVIIGAELCVMLLGGWNIGGFGLMAAQVGAGQLVPCIVGGLTVFAALNRGGLSKKLFKTS